jgi:hypothetical protein
MFGQIIHPNYSPQTSRNKLMKRYGIIFLTTLLVLSACTLIVPALFDAQIARVEHLEGGLLAVYLRNAEDGYSVKVNGVQYDCEFLDDGSGLLRCVGPAFEPGDELVIEFFEEGNDDDPLVKIDFIVPEIPDELKDQDDDGVPDSEDLCPGNSQKTEPGVCGCGAADTDRDSDGTADCKDGCPDNPEKTQPDDNGCDEGKKDSDDDGIDDDDDGCPDDPDKDDPGVCGCGTSDADDNKNGIPDCEDICDSGYSDLIGDPCDDDEDNDGYKDGADQCPYDPKKKEAGYCGCGNPETDTDKDGTPDCVDQCPEDKERIVPGECGCSGDDCEEEKCSDGSKHDSVGDPCNHDEDGDGIEDWKDICPFVFGLKKYDGCPAPTPTPTPCP